MAHNSFCPTILYYKIPNVVFIINNIGDAIAIIIILVVFGF